MRHTPFKFMAFALALAVGCSKTGVETPKEENETPVAPVQKTVTLKADLGKSTKVAFDRDGKFSWNKDDAIAVYTSKNRFIEFALIDGAETNSATFQGTLDGDEQISKTAVFPYQENLALNGNNLSLNLPAEITNVDGQAETPMLAKIANGEQTSLSFKHLGGMFKLTVTNVPLGADTFVFTTTGKKIAGECSVDISVDTPVAIASETAEEEQTSICLKVAAPATTETSATYLIPVPTGTYASHTVKYLDQFGYEIDGESKTFEESVTIDRATGKQEEWSEWDALPAPKNVKLRRLDWNAVVFQWNRQTSGSEKEIKNLGDKCGNCFEYEIYKVNGNEKTLIKNFQFRYNYKYCKIEDGSYFNAVAFGNLEAETNYKIRIRSLSKNNSFTSYNADTGVGSTAWTGYTDAHNSAWTEIEFKTPAKPVDGAEVVYAERFDNLMWGTDIVNFGAGFKPTNAEITAASNLDDLDTKANYQYPDKTVENLDKTEVFKADFVTSVLVPNATSTKLYPHLGYVKFGTTGTPGTFTTKEFSSISGYANLKLTFGAARYVTWDNNKAKPEEAVIKVTVYKKGAELLTEPFTLTDDWETYSVDIPEADATTYIKFESTKSGKVNRRLLLDNIIVTKQ